MGGLPEDVREATGIEGLRTAEGDVVRNVSTLFDLRRLFEAGYFEKLMTLLDKKLAGEPAQNKPSLDATLLKNPARAKLADTFGSFVFSRWVPSERQTPHS